MFTRIRAENCFLCVCVCVAGTVMLELGVRLGREVCSVRGLKKQVNCFLAAINCLRLIRPEYAWMVLPVSEVRTHAHTSHARRSWLMEFCLFVCFCCSPSIREHLPNETLTASLWAHQVRLDTCQSTPSVSYRHQTR